LESVQRATIKRAIKSRYYEKGEETERMEKELQKGPDDNEDGQQVDGEYLV